MTDTETFQLSLRAAEAYEAKFVPSLFAEWAPRLLAATDVAPGCSALDVACGTGVVARAAAERVGPSGTVVGIDSNPSMLAVARRRSPQLEWHLGDAHSLPFDQESFDVVVCQAALMFFANPLQALREMRRVVTAEGTVAVQVWAGLDAQPGYGPFVEVAVRHAGDDAARLLGSYWALGDVAHLRALFTEAGLDVQATSTQTGMAHFASVDELVAVEVESTPLADRLTDEVYARILADARATLADHQQAGHLALPIVGHILAARPAGHLDDTRRDLFGAHRFGAATGSTTRNTVRPGVDSTVSSPPWSSTTIW